MRPPGPTSWRLDRRIGWQPLHADGVTADARDGLRLQADPGGTRSPGDPAGTLGGLVLPETVAVDAASRLFLLVDPQPRLRRFDAAAGGFVRLPHTGERGSGARELARPTALAAAGRDLLVADPGNRRVTVFDTGTLALRALWQVAGWNPTSVAAGPGGGYVLDSAHGTVHRFPDALGPPEVIVPAAAGRWRRVAVDRDGRVYLLRVDGTRLDVVGPDGADLGSIADAGEVTDRFDPPAVTADHRGRLRVAAALRGRCPGVAEPGAGDRWFDPRTGEPATFADDEWIGPPTYLTGGTWISGPLDSAIYRCQWHRVVLDLGRLPAGSRVRIGTYTNARSLPLGDVLALPEDRWSAVPDLVGPAAQQRSSAPPLADTAVLSREGRYLWLRLQLSGDGHDTPTVRGARVHYPRHSRLELLPAVYSADDAARRFLERFLAVFQTQLEPVERTITDMAGLFDPAAATPAMVDVLSSWLAVSREGDWGPEQRRVALRAVPGTVTRRGTPAALRAHLRAYLQNITGLPLAEAPFPHVVEGYRERNHIALTGRDPAGGRIPLWSPGTVARLQLGRFATEGRVRLLTTGDPDRDVFHHYAHRFRLVIPQAWVRTAPQERMLRRAVEAEKPAHVGYQLTLIAAGIRVGRQATLGLDTVIGALPRTRLGCRHDTGAAPSRPPRGRLGVDTVLSAHPDRPADLRLTARVGDHATLL